MERGGGFEPISEVLRRASQGASPGKDGSASTEASSTTRTETRTEARACTTCGREFLVELEVRDLRGRQVILGNRRECDPCRIAREERERQEEEAELRLKKLKAREEFLHRSGLPLHFRDWSFERWVEQGFPQHKAFKQVRSWAEKFPVEDPRGYPSLVLHSDQPGVGKTTLVGCAIGAIIQRWDGDPDSASRPVRYETGPSLNLRVRATYEIRPEEAPWRETEVEVYRSLRGVRLLVLDDVGDPDKEPPSEHTRRVYFHIIDQRYGDGLPVLVVTNSREELLERVMGRYTVDRLFEMAQGRFITISGQTRRQRFTKIS